MAMKMFYDWTPMNHGDFLAGLITGMKFVDNTTPPVKDTTTTQPISINGKKGLGLTVSQALVDESGIATIDVFTRNVEEKTKYGMFSATLTWDSSRCYVYQLVNGDFGTFGTDMQSSEMSAKGYDSLLSDFIYAINLFRPTLTLYTRDVNRTIVDYMKREYPEAYSSISQASSYMESKIREGEDYASELYEGSVVKQAAEVTSKANDDAVNILRRADALLASAEKTMRAYAASYQETYDKIMSLSNIGVNIYTNEGFQTKYLSCYVGGSASLLLGKVLEKYLLKINEMADKLNRMLQRIANALKKYFDKITCILKNMNLSISGYTGYSTVRTGFLGVQLNMNCIVS